MDEAKLLYSESHEWAHLEGDVCTIGISRFAVDQLTDVVFVELPAAGTTVSEGDSFGAVESVKAVSDLYAPLSGEVIEVNHAVENDPGILNQDPFGAGWMIKIRVSGTPDVSRLKDKAAYDAQCAEDAH